METYQTYLKKGLSRYFDIVDDFRLGNHVFDFFAGFNQRSAKYMLMRHVEIYAYNTHEYIFHKKLTGPFTEEDYEWLVGFYKDHALEVLATDNEHMSSTVTMIIECQLPDKGLAKKVQRYKFYKSFAFGLKGWVNGKVILVDSEKNQGIANRLGQKELHRFLRE